MYIKQWMMWLWFSAIKQNKRFYSNYTWKLRKKNDVAVRNGLILLSNSLFHFPKVLKSKKIFELECKSLPGNQIKCIGNLNKLATSLVCTERNVREASVKQNNLWNSNTLVVEWCFDAIWLQDAATCSQKSHQHKMATLISRMFGIKFGH